MKSFKLHLIWGIIALLLSTLLPMCQKNNIFSKPTIINIQPFQMCNDSINEYDINKFDHYLKSIGLKNYIIKVLPEIEEPLEYQFWHTYEDIDFVIGVRADSLVKYLNTLKKGEFIIGVTDTDLKADVHGVKNYGIMGLSYLNRSNKACITSTRRLKKRKDLWKLMAHEFTHCYFSKRHCKADDPHCLMQDAKGGNPHFEIKDSLCNVCKAEIKPKLNN